MMRPYRAVLQRSSSVSSHIQAARHVGSQTIRQYSRSHQRSGSRGGRRFVRFLTIFGLSAGAVYYFPRLFPGTDIPKPVEAAVEKVEVAFEKKRKPAPSKEASRDLISSQHQQVKQSWEKPGVYAWGSNAGKVIDPDSKETYFKSPHRIPYFDGQLLRDLKLAQEFGVAVMENGDMVQWGTGFSDKLTIPTTTLKGKDIIQVSVSADRVIALSSNGAVYSVPASLIDQESGIKQDLPAQGSSWIPLWSGGPGSKERYNHRILTPPSLARGEKVTNISSGLQHCLMLTSAGRVFSAASSTLEFPSRGQLGIPGLSWETRPAGAYDQAHEIVGLRSQKIVKVAAGDHHSAVLTKDGAAYTFGDNTFGQLGFDTQRGGPIVDSPRELPLAKLYASEQVVPKITSIAAGGANTFFTVDATSTAPGPTSGKTVSVKGVPPVRSDTWACGRGVYGALGNGKWTHVSPRPARISSLSSVFEFDDTTGKIIPIRLSHLSVGSTHVGAVMGNATKTTASQGGSASDTNWGSDMLFWGGNEHYQLGTGKRTNVNSPRYIETDVESDGEGKSDTRLQLTPRQTVRLGEGGKGRKVSVEQRLECGRNITAVYSSP
jgi:alpha-tubulin suppressor-like RCC1 family protein